MKLSWYCGTSICCFIWYSSNSLSSNPRLLCIITIILWASSSNASLNADNGRNLSFVFLFNFDQNCPHDLWNSGVLCTSKQRSDQRRQPLCFWSSEAHDSGRKIKIINWQKTWITYKSNFLSYRKHQTIVIKNIVLL